MDSKHSAGFNQRIIFRRMLPDGTIIKDHLQGLQVLAEGVAYCSVATDTFFCNGGDIVVVDIQLEVIFGTSAVYSFRSTDVGVCDGEPVEFSGSGEPIQGGDLVPTDGTGFQAVINKFRYPLSREEITGTINDTTKGLAFTRSTDPTTLQTNNISGLTYLRFTKEWLNLNLNTPATMAHLWIDNQPLVSENSLAASCCGQSSFAQLITRDDKAHIQFTVYPCEGTETPDFIEGSFEGYWFAEDGLICNTVSAPGAWDASWENTDLFVFFQVTLTVTSMSAGTLTVNLDGAETYTITSAGTYVLYFKGSPYHLISISTFHPRTDGSDAFLSQRFKY